MIVGKDDDARDKAAPLHFGKHDAAVHVGELPSDNREVESRRSGGDCAKKCLATLNAANQVEPAVVANYVAQRG